MCAALTRGPGAAGLLAVAVSAVGLATALVSQYGFDLYPCLLCHYQRYALIVALGCGVATLLLAPRAAAVWPARLAALALLAGAAVALFHVGVEAGWWQGLEGCSTPAFNSAMSPQEIKDAIMKAPVVACDQVAFRFLGLSMAGWNLIYSALAGLAVAWLAQGKGGKA